MTYVVWALAILAGFIAAVCAWLVWSIAIVTAAMNETAAPELRSRHLDFYQTTEPDQAARDGAVLPIGLSSRIAESAATSNHNARSRI